MEPPPNSSAMKPGRSPVRGGGSHSGSKFHPAAPSPGRGGALVSGRSAPSQGQAHHHHQRTLPHDVPSSRLLVADSPQYFSRPPTTAPSRQETKPEYPPFIN
eukprot:TRINITY_DN2728_c0_g3_i1.p2 TRINITY_DN2728_c0_g3~~TRINITY_DN2728_c0_g3_i1.p2  ORF type:complete len:115 (+),score=1.79 TRINITY_DN2728_c0_g3_i1:41-346(+)